MKKALLLCATHNDLGLIRSLKKLGFYIIATGGIKNLHGEKLCDKFILADYSNKELILQIAKQEKISAVVQNCNDFGVYSAAFVAENLGLKGYDSYQTTLTIHNKDKFKQFCLENDIPSPISKGFDSERKAQDYIESSSPTYPLIIKPIDLSGGKGVSVATNATETKQAIAKAFAISRAKRIVIEPFIKGSQHGYCTFLLNGKIAAICSNNEYSILNPYRVEMDTFPADNFDKVSQTLNSTIEKIAKILHLKDGIFHCQYIYDGQKVWIIEAMRRILGNMYHIPSNLLTNMDWEYWETRAKCGLSLQDFPKRIKQEGFFAYKTILADKNGIFENVHIPKVYEKYICGEYMLRKRGYKIEKFDETPLGFLFLQFSSAKQMQEVLVKDFATLGKVKYKTKHTIKTKSKSPKSAKTTKNQHLQNPKTRKQNPPNKIHQRQRASNER